MCYFKVEFLASETYVFLLFKAESFKPRLGDSGQKGSCLHLLLFININTFGVVVGHNEMKF